MTDDQLERIEPYFNFWCVRTITNSAGRYGRVGKYATMVTDEVPEVAEQHEETPDITPLQFLYWYESELLKLYAELGSARKVAKAIGVPRRSIDTDIRIAKQKARELLKRNM